MSSAPSGDTSRSDPTAAVTPSTGLPDLGSARLDQFAAAVRADPEQIGPYRILGRVGEGGMGVIFRAEQREPVRRTVAIKLVRWGMDSDQVLARFESERHALAIMDHPHVAKVLDAGVTEGGRPYFVMEFVAGQPITAFCDHHNYSTEQRLNLFLQACQAVQHAHQKAIIHRDLKPSNILVTMVDDKPIVKVIDFGVAKAVTERLTDRTLYTSSGQLVGTPEYMSPEQAEGSLDIDTRTDVYALGVVLYELLCGALPFDPASLRSGSFADVQRIIRDVEPPRPSARLTGLGSERAAQVAQRRRAPVAQLTGQLRRELEWIPLKAMHKDRTRRYATADQLAEDVRNYLEQRPLLAGPESLRYRAGKFVRRNKGAVVGVTAVVLALVIGGVVSSALAIRLKRTADAVRAEQQTTQAVLQFLTDDILGAANPEVSQVRDMSVKQALDNAAAGVERKFADQPLVEAAVRQTLVNTYLALGLPDAALPHAQAAVAQRRRVLGDDDPETIAAQSDLGLVYHTMGNFAEAESIYRDVLDRARRALGNEHRHTLTAISNLAMLYGAEGKPAEAEPLLREALAYRRRTLGDDHPDTLILMNNLGGLLQWQGKLPEAESLFRQVLAGRRRTLGEDHPETLLSITNLGGIIQEQGKPADAEPLFRDALASRRRVLGDDHPDTLQTMHILGRCLMRQDRPAEAEPLFAEVYRRAPGAKLEPKRTAELMCNWGICLAKLGRDAEAEPALREAQRRFAEAGVETPKPVLDALAHVTQAATRPATTPARVP